MDDFEVSVSIPLDSDGFIRRECPKCERQFKWHDGPANAEAEHQPSPDAYYCPMCGEPAGLDSWWTQEQLDYAQGMIAPAAMHAVADELDQAFNGLKSNFIKLERGRLDTPATPMPLTEPDDMMIVTSPCHTYEPVKVVDHVRETLHCLVCGAKFAV